MFNYTPIKRVLALTLGLVFLPSCQTITLNNTVPVTAVPTNESEKDESELLAQLASSLPAQTNTMHNSQMDEADEMYEPVSNNFSPTRHHVRLDPVVVHHDESGERAPGVRGGGAHRQQHVVESHVGVVHE